MSKVVVGLSGGVDSSVAAHLLVDQGHEVIGLFMKNWHDDSVTISDECPWLEDSNDALIVAEKLGIPFQTIDLSSEYKARIVDYMIGEYEIGRTPNPDVLCNREIKFDIFLKTALDLGADFVATGHYVRKTTDIQGHHLLAGLDDNKDQSYFLCQLSQYQLSKALFPVGDLKKPTVRDIAKNADLITAEKKDSQGLCFIGKVKLPDFLQQQLKPKKGTVIEISPSSSIYDKKTPPFSADLADTDLDALSTAKKYHTNSGKKKGEHNGAHFFTIGQRKGLGIGGTKEPLFVLETDTTENIIYVGEGERHPGLLRPGLSVNNLDVHWLQEKSSLETGKHRSYDIRIRYRQPLERGTLLQREEKLYVIFDHPQKAIAAGQFVAWYDGEELIGSGVIS